MNIYFWGAASIILISSGAIAYGLHNLHQMQAQTARMQADYNRVKSMLTATRRGDDASTPC